MDTVSLHALVDVTLQTNVDSRLGSIRCPAVQKRIPDPPSLRHPANVVPGNIQHSINTETFYTVCFKYSSRINLFLKHIQVVYTHETYI